MTTIDNTGRPAFMYDEDSETWYAISGRISTAANYVWTGANEWQNNSFFTGNVVAKNKINSFLNPAARTAAIPSPGTGLITFLEQDAVGNTINRFEFWNGTAWVVMADLTSTQTLTNKTLTSPILNSPAISGGSASGTITGNPSFSGNITFSGSNTLSGSISGGTISSASVVSPVFTSPEEVVTVSATSATGTVNFDCLTQGVLYYTSNAGGNFTLNFRGNGATALNTVLSNGQSITCSFLNTNGGSAFYPTAFQVDGASVTPKWAGGTAPTSGNVSSIDAYTFTIVKTANATFTILAGAVQFK